MDPELDQDRRRRSQTEQVVRVEGAGLERVHDHRELLHEDLEVIVDVESAKRILQEPPSQFFLRSIVVYQKLEPTWLNNESERPKKVASRSTPNPLRTVMNSSTSSNSKLQLTVSQNRNHFSHK